MGRKSPSLVCFFIYIAIASYLFGNANGSSYTDLTITDNVSARLYVSYTDDNNQKLPLVVYYHGGGFIVGSATDLVYNNFVGDIVDHSNVIALSVNYRLNNVQNAYDDSWTALQYVASHQNGSGTNPTLNTLVDFEKIYLAGDSAGGNIAHNMAMKIATNEILGLRLKGIALLCPFFWGRYPLLGESPFDRYIEDSLWISSAQTTNLDDVRINPLVDPNLANIGTSKVLVITGLYDPLFYRGRSYVSTLQTKGYKGEVLYHEHPIVHVFFLYRWFYIYYGILLDQVSNLFNSD